MGNRLRDSGNEYGAVTGRPRRCGWYDAVAVRYGVRINGLDALALTKLDVLDGLRAHRGLHRLSLRRPHPDGDSVGHRPAGGVRAGVRIDAGMDDPDQGRCGGFEDLPDNAQALRRRGSKTVTGVPAAIVSTGSERDDTIVREELLIG